ncbi:Homeobox protein Hox-A5 [Homalodisca vitripennis]|nr:Homeobox protein Hox-A5 [Homalodisca vitripennis]
MSSYQFVNSLASCYQQGQAVRSGASPVDPSHPQHPQASSPGSEYYNANPGVVSSYAPGGCYSPQQYAGQYMHQSGDMIDYTQLHSSHNRLGVGHLQPLHHHTVSSPGAVSPILNNNTTVTNLSSNSCKYADSTTATTNVSSPQDLSTGGQPARSSSPIKSTPASSARTSASASATSPATSAAQNSSTAASQSSSSPASSTSSNSSNTGNNSTSKTGTSGNPPPQIYPWMKRVHLGQTIEYETRFCFLSVQIHTLDKATKGNFRRRLRDNFWLVIDLKQMAPTSPVDDETFGHGNECVSGDYKELGAPIDSFEPEFRSDCTGH